MILKETMDKNREEFVRKETQLKLSLKEEFAGKEEEWKKAMEENKAKFVSKVEQLKTESGTLQSAVGVMKENVNKQVYCCKRISFTEYW